MEFCRRWGIVPAVEGSPYPRDYPQDNIYLTSLTGYELGRERFPGIGQAPPPPQSPQRRERCPQNMFDPILREFAASQKAVELRYRTRLVSFTQDAACVTATIENAETGRARRNQGALHRRLRWRAQPGARDARHPDARQSGADVHDKRHFPLLRISSSLHDKGKAYRHICIGPEGTWATIVAINGRDQWRFSIIGSEQQREYRPKRSRRRSAAPSAAISISRFSAWCRGRGASWWPNAIAAAAPSSPATPRT